MVVVATLCKVCFPRMLMSRIDGIRSCLEDYILLFLFDVCIYIIVNRDISEIDP